MTGQQIIIDGIFDNIITLKLKAGDRLLSIRKLSEKYSVAHTTAWKACIALQDMGLVSVKYKRGYFITHDAVEKVKKNLFQRKRRVVILSSFESEPLDDFYPRIYQLLVSKLATNIWRDRLSLLSVFRIDELENILTIGETDVLIVVGIILPEKLLNIIKQKNIRFLCLEFPQGDQLPAVKWDEHAAGYEIGKHLADLGHQRFAWFGKKNMNRINGVLHALEDAKISQKTFKIFECDNSPDEVCKIIEKLVEEQELPEALIFFYDGMAVQAIKTLQVLEIEVPRQVSVASFGNTHYAAYIHPELTSVNFDERFFVKETLNALEDLLFGKLDSKKARIIQTELISRNSCAPPGSLINNIRDKVI